MSSRFGRKQKRKLIAWLEAYEFAFKECYGAIKTAKFVIETLKDKEVHEDALFCAKRAALQDFNSIILPTIEKYR